eukprot:CFRG6017T1
MSMTPFRSMLPVAEMMARDPFFNSSRSLLGMLANYDPFSQLSEFVPNVGRRKQPVFSVHEEEKAVVIEAETPGFKKENLSVDLEDDCLIIKGEMKEETATAAESQDSNVEKISESDDKGTVSISDTPSYKSSSYASFRQSFRMPKELKGSQMNASYADGILQVRLIRPEIVPQEKVSVMIE